ncbi:MAG TPA: PilT/PilU family type 4a pilus ATPase [Xanthomonadaceae bacterium]|nr:PilT/PilU family type 4a pilus ATPase [Xanthomonadaceae bacterium]
MPQTLELSSLLGLMAARKASDLLLSVGAPPALKVEGETQALGSTPLTPQDVEHLAYGIMNERQQKAFEADMEMNLALAVDNVGRFRVNLYRQRGNTAIVIRHITHQIPSIESLNLPGILKDLVMTPRGLVLVAGAAGSGKSTTLASMVDHRNQSRTGHILTIEDPIEYVHTHKESIVDQREIGLDTLSFASALRNAMREAPDVILIGEIRDRETMQAAITYAETGHLCLSTLHSNNANQTLDRIVNFFPEAAHRQLLLDLSLNLKAVISQRLIRGVDGRRIPAVEILLSTPYVSDLIQKGEFDTLKDAMKQGLDRGMMTFDESLFRLYEHGRINYETAIENADSRTDLSLRIRLTGHAPDDDALQLSS